jgi:beta-glucosidase
MLNNFHFIAKDYAEAAALGLNAGVDVELPTAECYAEPLKMALEDGKIDIGFVDNAVTRHLTMKLALGLFENPYVDEGHVIEVFETPNQRNLALEIAQKSMVLLKNDGILPLKKKQKKLAVIGPNAHSPRNQLGDYSYWAMSELVKFQAPMNHSFTEEKLKTAQGDQIKVISILEGIKEAISPDTEVLFSKGSDFKGEDRSGISEAVDIAKDADVVILVLGDCSGLVPECTTGETRDNSSLKLPAIQEDLAKAVIETGKPVILVLINGRPYTIPWLAENVDAIVEAWLPGEEGGRAVANVIFGDVNPGGKSPLTFPRSVGQLPKLYLSSPAGRKSNWWGDYVDSAVTPLFPFGHGLSYTTFEYGDLSISPQAATKGEEIEISFNLRNTGDVPGEEVVQLYIHDKFASSPRPVKELKGYHRLALSPGESKNITFKMNVEQCAFYNNDLNLVLEPGTIEVMLGSSSEDIRLFGAFEITGPEQMEVKERVFHCAVFDGSLVN